MEAGGSSTERPNHRGRCSFLHNRTRQGAQRLCMEIGQQTESCDDVVVEVMRLVDATDWGRRRCKGRSELHDGHEGVAEAVALVDPRLQPVDEQSLETAFALTATEPPRATARTPHA